MNCVICDKVFTGIENFKQHEASAKHKKKLEMHKMQSQDSFHNTDEIHKMPNLQAISCHLCSETFSNLLEYQNHCVSEKHARMVLKEKSEPFQANNELPVSDCAVDSTHDVRKQISQLNVKPDFPVNFSSCDTCGKNFSGLEPYLQHIASSAHKKKEALAASQPFANNNFECKMCVKRFSGPEPYQQHLDSINHKKKLLAKEAPNTCNICDEHFDDLQLYQQHINTDSHKALSNGKPNLIAAWHCDVCDKPCSGPVPYNQHMKSETHRKKVSTQCMLRQITKGSDVCSRPEAVSSLSPDYYCEFCKKQCPDAVSYREHVLHTDHARKFVNSAAESKRKEIEILFSPQASESSVELAPSKDEIITRQEKNNVKPVRSSEENIKPFLFEDSSFMINPNNFNISVFRVGEEIDFDKKVNHLNSNDLVSDEIDEQNDEEIMYDECPSP